MEGKVLQKGTWWESSISSRLELELEGSGAPLACVTVEHGALCEGDIPFCVYQDYSIGSEWEDGQKHTNSDHCLNKSKK